jgi:hypothetical protein
MADKDVTLGIQADTSGLKAGAESGAQALAKLEESIKGDTQALAQMQKALRELKGSANANTEQIGKLHSQIAAKKEAIATARGEYLALGGTFERSRRGGKAFGAQLAELNKITQGIPGPLGSAVSAFSRLISTIANNPIKTALVGIAAAMIAVQLKLVSLTLALTRYAVAQADARRSELLRLEGLTKVRNYYGVAAGSAQDLQDSIDKVSASSALSREQIAGLATQLYKAHFRGEALTDALDAAAIKTSTQGQEQASMWIGYAEAINRTGGNVKGFAQNVRNQLGGIAQKQMLSLDVQARKLEESYSALTTGIRIEPLLKAKAGFNALFAQSTASGRALKALLGTIVQPIINQITRVIPVAKRFFQGMILAALEFGTAVLEVAASFGVTFGDDVPDALDDSTAAINTGKAAFDLLVGTLTSLSFVTGLVVLKQSILAIIAIPATIRAFGRMLVSIYSQIVAWGAWALEWLVIIGYMTIVKGMQLGSFFATLLTAVAKQVIKWGAWALEILLTISPLLLLMAALWGVYKIFELFYVIWREIDWKDLGRMMWEGLTSWFVNVGEFFKNIGGKIVKAFRTAFDSHSPSRVFMGIGEDIGEGLQQGIDATAPDVNQSVAHMVEAADGAAGPGAAGGSSTAAPAGGTVVIQAINLQGYSDPAQAANDFVTELAKTLRTVGYQLGTVGGATP